MGLRPEGVGGGAETRGGGRWRWDQRGGTRGKKRMPVCHTENFGKFPFSDIHCFHYRTVSVQWTYMYETNNKMGPTPVYTTQYKYSLQYVQYSCCHNKISSFCLLHPDPTTIDLCHTC